MNSLCFGFQARFKRSALHSAETLRPGPLNAGFTLVELLVTMVIMAILLAMAVPSFQTFVLNNRTSGLRDSLVNSLNYARGSALKTNVSTIVCPVGAAGSPTCGNNWGTGWMVIADPTGTPTLLQSSIAAAGGPLLSATAANGSALSSAAFDARGLAGTPANFKICDSRGAAYAKSVQTLATGLVQAAQTPGQAVWGGTLTCP